MSLSVRRSFRARSLRIVEEFAVAVTLCAIVVVFAGGLSDVSMRIGIVLAAIFLTAAETHRQMPELARHVMAPLRRHVREELQHHAPVQRSDGIGETIDLRQALESVATVTRQSAEAYANVERTIQGVDLRQVLESVATVTRQLAAAFANVERTVQGVDQVLESVATVTRQSAEAYANVERTVQGALAEWRDVSRDRDQSIVAMFRTLSERSVVREELIRDAVRQLDRIAKQIESASTIATPLRNPSDPTPEAWSSYETQLLQLRHAAMETFEKVAQTAAWRVEAELILSYEDLRIRDAIMHSLSVPTVEAQRALSLFREVGLPHAYFRQAELFRSLRSDPEAFRRFIDELVAKIAQMER